MYQKFWNPTTRRILGAADARKRAEGFFSSFWILDRVFRTTGERWIASGLCDVRAICGSLIARSLGERGGVRITQPSTRIVPTPYPLRRS